MTEIDLLFPVRGADGRPLPIVVDLDGSLTASDTVWDAVAGGLAKAPVTTALLLARAPISGKAQMKLQLEALGEGPADPVLLPWRAEVLALLQAARARGHDLHLMTGSMPGMAQAVAQHLDLFASVTATDATINLTGTAKAEAAIRRFGAKGFLYLGNSREDLPVWAASAGALVVASTRALPDRRIPARVLWRHEPAGHPATALLRLMRPHQWIKNLLCLVPLITSRSFLDPERIPLAFAAVAVLSLAASAGYVLNDLLDIPADRADPKKRHRPLAAGTLPVPLALAAGLGLMLLAVAAGLLVDLRLGALTILYLGLTFAYSLRLKGALLVDVLLLAMLYVLRIIAGAAAIGVAMSVWLLTTGFLFFLSLALIKRVNDLQRLEATGILALPRRNYRVEDRAVLLPLGVSALTGMAVVLAIYIDSDREASRVYAAPELLWLLIPGLMFWGGRLWVKTVRGEMSADPVVFAIRDRTQRIAFAAMGLAYLAALFLPI